MALLLNAPVSLDAAAVTECLHRPGLVDAFARIYAEGGYSPLRQHLHDREHGEFLVMSAISSSFACVKSLTITPTNAALGRQVIQGQVNLFERTSGRMLATIDAGSLTAYRTATVSALAARALARPGAKRILILGSGHLVPYLAWAHAQVRPLLAVTIWARRPERAEVAAARVRKLLPDVSVSATQDLASAANKADIISTATGSTEPLLCSAWLRPGTHVDLVGGYRPHMREVDDASLARGSIYVDTREGALAEAGDLIGPIARGVIDVSAIMGELADLVTCSPQTPLDLSIFKSVGTARADLAIAQLLWSRGLE